MVISAASKAFYLQSLPASEDAEHAPHILLIHGWAADERLWMENMSQLRARANIHCLRIEAYRRFDLAELLAVLPPRFIAVGWSLGGNIATRLAALAGERCQALVCLASNPCFVANATWPSAMAAEVFAQFYQGFERSAAPSLKRFLGLQAKGASDERRLMRALRQLQVSLAENADGEAVDDLLEGLRWLRDGDERETLAALDCPQLHILAEADALVPVTVAEALPGEVVKLPGSHALFQEQAELLWQQVFAFLQPCFSPLCEKQFDKREVARSFSLAADSYDAVADLQRRVADELAQRLPATCGAAADLGCGTGYSLPELLPRAERVFALDLAEGMLQTVRARQPSIQAAVADAEDLPLADDSLDLVFSSLAVQWCENHAALMQELHRVLRPGGRALLATLGPATLNELRQAWEQVDEFQHVNRFAPRSAIEGSIADSGLQLLAWDEVTEQMKYQALSELMRELKQLGAHNVNQARPTGLTGRARLRALTAAYEAYREPGAEGLLPASYQVWYLQLQKPA